MYICIIFELMWFQTGHSLTYVNYERDPDISTALLLNLEMISRVTVGQWSVNLAAAKHSIFSRNYLVQLWWRPHRGR